MKCSASLETGVFYRWKKCLNPHRISVGDLIFLMVAQLTKTIHFKTYILWGYLIFWAHLQVFDDTHNLPGGVGVV